MRPCRRFLFPILVCGCGGAAVRAQVWAPLQHQVTREWLSRENVEYPRRFPPAGEYPARIPLVTDPGAAPLGEVCPLGAGFPLREGQVTALGTLALVGAAQGRVPAVFEARTTWPDGSARWVWVDFAGLPTDSYSVEFDRDPAPLPAGVKVNADEREIRVSGGRLELVFARQAGFPTSVTRRGAANAAWKGDGQGIYLVDASARRAVMAGPEAELQWVVETAHPLRAVIRVEGWYVDAEGRRPARGILRYHIFRDAPWVRLEHTFVIAEDFPAYQEVGLRLPLSGEQEPQIAFGFENANPVRVSGFDTEAAIVQETFPVFHRKESTARVLRDGIDVATAAAAAGWADARAGDVGLAVAVRDFAATFPKEICMTREDVTVKLWSGRNGMVLDYAPATLAAQWWGTWLERLPFSSMAKRSGDRWPTPEKVVAMKPSAVGAARSHDLILEWYGGSVDPRKAARLHGFVQAPPVVQPDPVWMMHCDPRIMLPMLASAEMPAEYQDVEWFISTWFDRHRAPLDVFPMTGWYYWGKHPDLRYEKLPDGTIYAQWYRLNNTNYYYHNRNVMYAWARSADRKYLDVAERVNQWLADSIVVHWDGGRDRKVRGFETGGDGHLPLHWTGSTRDGSSSSEMYTGFAYEYLLRDQRRLKDVLGYAREAYRQSFPTRYVATADMRAPQLMAVLSVFADPVLEDALRASVRQIYDPASETGLRAEFWKGRNDELYKVFRKCANALAYYDFTGDAWIVPAAVRMALGMTPRYVKQYANPVSYQNYTPYIAARVYELTRDPDWLAWADYQINGLMAMYRKLAAEPAVDPAVFFASRVIGPARSSGSGRYAFDIPSIQGKAVLDFGGDKAVLLISYPAALQVLSGTERAP